jgi:3-oxocholest-4-en-26-oyl-CoA dehydrogenase alpha subunit
MHLALTPGQEAFRDEVRAYFASVMTPAILAQQRNYEIEAGAYRDLIRRIGADGWLCVSWPEEYGGRGLSEVEQFIYFDEVQRLGVPIPFLTTNTVGPTIMAYGSDEQKQRFLPGIQRGEIHFSIGYSEAEAGTDLASLRTRAQRDGDHYVINGQKMWTSLIDRADYVWLACRTDPDAAKHQGISIIIVPTTSDGFSWTRIDTMGGGLTSTTYYEDVRVPVDNLVGAENDGWRLMTAQLNQERIALSSSGVVDRRLTEVVRWAQEAKLADGRRVIDQEWAQLDLARVRAQLEFLRLLNWKVAWSASQGQLDPADASAMKVFGSEFYVSAWRLLQEVVGRAATVAGGSPGAVLEGDLEVAMRAAPILTFGGGTNEIQRDLIAALGLGLPRAPR